MPLLTNATSSELRAAMRVSWGRAVFNLCPACHAAFQSGALNSSLTVAERQTLNQCGAQIPAPPSAQHPTGEDALFPFQPAAAVDSDAPPPLQVVRRSEHRFVHVKHYSMLDLLNAKPNAAREVWLNTRWLRLFGGLGGTGRARVLSLAFVGFFRFIALFATARGGWRRCR